MANRADTPPPIAPLATRLRRGANRLLRSMAGVRGRSMLLAASVVAVALSIGAVGLVAVYRNQLMSSLDNTLEQQVNDRIRLLESGNPAEPLATALEEESMVWIGLSDGTVIVTGGSLLPIGNPIPPTIGVVSTLDLTVEEIHPGESGVEREESAIRMASGVSTGGVVVLAGAEVETVDHAVAAIGRLFGLSLPPIVALVAALSWLTTGRALKPVEDIRSKAAEISGTNLAGRVPVPGSGDEVAELATTMNAMLERIESHEYSLRQFTADASHELKSPVANLRALVDTANLDDQRWPVLQRQLVGESERLKDLVDNLLFLASHEAGRSSGQPVEVALDELLFVEAELVAATGAVTVDLSGVEPAEVTGSATDLARLVRNLVDNAARHASGKVALGIEVGLGQMTGDQSSTTAISLLIGDDGAGIAPEDRQRVFERFARLDDARTRGDGGSGLGLAIVRQIAESHGATVDIGTSPLGGAEVRVRFHSP